jgi:apolipoprotein N-acyltransferase
VQSAHLELFPVLLTMRLLPAGISGWDGLWALTAGLVGAMAFPPLGVWPFALVSVCWLLVLLRDHSATQARTLGLLYGLAYGAGTMYWLFGIFGPVAVSFVALMAGYFGLQATLVGMTRHKPLLVRVAFIGFSAVAIEWLRGDAWYLRFPWYSVPHALAASSAWIAPARWLGTYGLSFMIWVIAATGALAGGRYWLAFALLPVCSLLLPEVPPAEHRATLVQVEEPHAVEPVLAQITFTDADLVVLPEYAYPFSLTDAIHSKEGPSALAQRIHCPVVFGSVEGVYGKPGFQNVAAVVDSTGGLLGTFPKQHPVPLMLDGKPGETRPVFPVAGGVLGVGICYDFDAPEVAASLVRSGATVLVAPIHDLLTWGRIQHVHHEMILRLRAVENNRWVLRTSSSGESEAIDPNGVPSAKRLEFGATGTVTVAYGHQESVGPGSYSSWFGPGAALVTVLSIAWSVAASVCLRKSPESDSPPRWLRESSADRRR